MKDDEKIIERLYNEVATKGDKRNQEILEQINITAATLKCKQLSDGQKEDVKNMFMAFYSVVMEKEEEVIRVALGVEQEARTRSYQ